MSETQVIDFSVTMSPSGTRRTRLGKVNDMPLCQGVISALTCWHRGSGPDLQFMMRDGKRQPSGAGSRIKKSRQPGRDLPLGKCALHPCDGHTTIPGSPAREARFTHGVYPAVSLSVRIRF